MSMLHWLHSDQLGVAVDVEFGARVCHLVDKASTRDWIAGGPRTSDVGEDAVFDGAAAYGWDECFPTVGACDATQTAWGRRLRDHGDLWGRPWKIVAESDVELTTQFAGDEFVFTRQLLLDGAVLSANYDLRNSQGRPLPFLWAQHGALAVNAGDRLVLDGLSDFEATYQTLRGKVLPPAKLDWPHIPGIGFTADIVQPPDTRFAAKLYATGARGRVSVHAGSDRLDMSWSGPIGHLGLWLNAGGWPDEKSALHHIAIEPTTSPDDDLAGALARGRAATLPPHGAMKWSVEIRLGTKNPLA